jgi:hypothetical protein
MLKIWKLRGWVIKGKKVKPNPLIDVLANAAMREMWAGIFPLKSKREVLARHLACTEQRLAADIQTQLEALKSCGRNPKLIGFSFISWVVESEGEMEWTVLFEVDQEICPKCKQTMSEAKEAQ